MHVALCINAVIPPPKYGGTERIVAWMIRALTQLGHRVTLVARAGSAVPGARVVPIEPGKSWEELTPSDCDILHLWAPTQDRLRRPYVITIEGNGKPGESFDARSLFVSRKHAENHGSSAYVYNGIDPDDYPCEPASLRGDSLVFLAKASWSVKNLEGALEVARLSGLPIEVLGSRDWPLHAERWLRWISRLKGVRYHGMVGDAYKSRILRRARALVFPVRWHEPFGIAVTEALASGCAVLATPYGSLSELVTPDVGVVAPDARTLARAASEVTRRYSPEACRARVYRGLTHLDMAREYLRHYESVVSKGHLAGVDPAAPAPRAPETFKAQDPLPWS